MKALLYIFTIGCAFCFAFLEMRLKRNLTDLAPPKKTAISDIGFLGDLKKKSEDERFLAKLPAEMKRELRWVVFLKFTAVIVLVLEVIYFQH